MELGDLKQFLTDFKEMLNEHGTEFPSPWSQVPEKYKEEFKVWCGGVKQQTWDDMWEQGWSNYHLEFLSYLIDICLGNLYS